MSLHYHQPNGSHFMQFILHQQWDLFQGQILIVLSYSSSFGHWEPCKSVAMSIRPEARRVRKGGCGG